MEHIAYVVKRFPRLSQTFVLHELLALERQGARVTVVALRRSADAPVGRYAELRAPVHYLGEADGPSASIAEQAGQVAEIVRAWGVSHIHAHFATRAASVADRASAATGVPFSFTAHAHDIFHADVDRAALAATIERASFVVTVSDYNRRYLEDLLALEGRQGRVARLYNGVDLRALQPSAAVRSPWLIASVGRLIAKKGFAHLVEAVRLLRASGRPARCVIVGEGEERPALERQIADAQLGDAVQLLGAMPPHEVAAVVGGASAFALPCVVAPDGDRDGLPTVLLEAMALGTPVVSTDVAGIPELVLHGRTGLLVPEAAPLRLAEALAHLLEDGALRARLSASARERMGAEFDLETNVGRLRGAFAHGAQALLSEAELGHADWRGARWVLS